MAKGDQTIAVMGRAERKHGKTKTLRAGEAWKDIDDCWWIKPNKNSEPLALRPGEYTIEESVVGLVKVAERIVTYESDDIIQGKKMKVAWEGFFRDSQFIEA